MLTLSRRTGERLVIGHSIVVEVKEIRRNQVALSVEAPKSVAIHRAEIEEKILREAKAAGLPVTPGQHWPRIIESLDALLLVSRNSDVNPTEYARTYKRARGELIERIGMAIGVPFHIPAAGAA